MFVLLDQGTPAPLMRKSVLFGEDDVRALRQSSRAPIDDYLGGVRSSRGHSGAIRA